MIRFEECLEGANVALNASVRHWNATFIPREIDVGNKQCIIDITLPWIGLSQILEIGETREYENTTDHRIYSLTLLDVFAGIDTTFVVMDVCYSPSLHACEKSEIVIEGGWSKHDHDGIVWYALYSVASDRNSCVLYIHCPWDGPLDETYSGRYETFLPGTIKTFGHDDYTTEYSFEIGNIYENSVDVIVCDDCLVPRVDDIVVTPEKHMVGEDVAFEMVPATRSGVLDNIWFKHDADYPNPMPIPYTPTFVRKYYAPGTYIASAKVDNECGHMSDVTTVEVVVEEECLPPTVTSMSWTPTVPNVGKPVQFSATADAGASETITSWYWEFGDGDTGSGQTTEHVYNTQGSFDVSITVINSCEAWSESFVDTIAIDEPLGVTTTICEGVEENCGAHRVEQIYRRELFTGGDRCVWLQHFCDFNCESIPWNTRYIQIEAEDADEINPLMEIASDPSAYNNSYIWVPDGGGWKGPGYARYNITITTPGDYKICGRAQAPTIGNNSFLVQMDDDPDRIWTIALTDSWAWDEVNHWGSGTETDPEIDPVIFTLSAGEHVLTIKHRECGTKLDRLLITDDLLYVPYVDTFDLSLLPLDREVVVVHMEVVGLELNANYSFNVKWFDPDNNIISNVTTDSFTGVYTYDEIEWLGYTASEIEKNGEYRVEVDLFEDGFPVFQTIKKTFTITGIPCAQPYCVFEVI